MTGISRQQLLALAVLLFLAVAVIGCFALIALGKVVPF